MSLVLLIVSACASVPSGDNIPQYSYMDSLTTAKRVNCSSKIALDCMACALQGEAANQPSRGVYAVGITIMTRAKGNVDRICRVTKARRQFEGMRRWGKRKISKKIWGIAEHIIESKETGWTHFYAPRTQADLRRRKPAWAHVYEKRQCKKEKIGDHIFYNTNQCKKDRRFRPLAQSF